MTVIEVTLTHFGGASEGSRRTQHKLGVDVPFNDIRPPSGVLSATLDCILLDVTIHHGLRLPNDTAIASRTPNSTHSACDEQTSHISSNADVTDFPQSVFPNSPHPDAGLCEADTAIEPLFLADSDEEIESLASEMLLEAENIDSQTTEHVLDILDAAIRRAISLSSGPLTKGMSVESDKAFRSLSSIAPALFRQYHLPAVASRAIFVPTISKSISAVSSRQANSKSMGSKANSMRPLDTFTFGGNRTNGISQQDAWSSILEQTEHLPQLLWRAIDAGLLGSKPERRLKPLSISFGDSQSSHLDDELLGVLEAPEACPLSMHEFEDDEYFLHESLEEDCYPDYEDMLDDLGTASDYGSDFGSGDEDGYGSPEELQRDHDYRFSNGNQDNKNPANLYDEEHMPRDVVVGEDLERVHERIGTLFWREDRNVPSSSESPKSPAISDDEMLAI